MVQISVVIPVFNKGFILNETLNSVLQQIFTNYEIIIINDGSTDNSLSVLSKFEDSRIQIYSQENKGAAAARNLGIEKSNGEFIAFLDADDYWFPNHLEELIKLSEQYPSCGSYCSRYQIKNTKNSVINPVFKDIPQDFNGILNNYFASNHPFKINITLNQMIPKKILIEMNCFTEGITNGQDLELWTKIGIKYPIAVHNKITAIYNNYLPNTLSKNSFKTMKLMDFKQFEFEEKENPHLKNFLDFHRIFYAKHYKIIGNEEKVRFYLNDVANENLSFMIKVLFKTPSSILNTLFKLKNWLLKKGISF
ncbi:glycosyltransferase family 2 protein [Flavobacterium sp.]|jgi:glycosyltransferase involved in cell wall biosynthesis|uniref:glycosyltransferase family 2 protein n=1 Tax=Flavobacterium sp. TaxID=239 RepID=UPI002A8389E5|nr:glycosyltransferase family 2 protein [Flavobacterium sp.]